MNIDYFSSLNPLQINLTEYNGPLDLLLELIKSKKKSITDIALSEICQPYLDYIHNRKLLDLNIDCEFIEIASTLILIKSRSLLPDLAGDVLESIEEIELKGRLVSHENFQNAIALLNAHEMLNRDIFLRQKKSIEIKQEKLFDINLINFLQAYYNILMREEAYNPYEYSEKSWDVEQKIIEIKAILLKDNQFQLFYNENWQKMNFITHLMALLELTKVRYISINQNKPFNLIVCYLLNIEQVAVV